jgi:pSer/pThr/pTyr-binding forkhead associated (FHA) protein
MRDGRTVKRRVRRAREADRLDATLVVLCGAAAGTEHPLRGRRTVLGRGPGAELVFADEQMSQQHAALERVESGFRVTDLGSTNGTRVNGTAIVSQEIAHGDRIELGRHVLQLVVEKRDAAPRAFVLRDA